MSSSFPGPLTEKEEQYYVQQLEQNDPDARRILIERNLRLVAHIARKYISPGTCQDDLISIGTIGLIKAVNTYTAARSTRLATYAAKCIENAILSQMRLWFQINPLRVKKNPNGAFWHKLPTDSPSQAVRSTGVQTLRSLFTCFFYGCGFDNRIQ